MSRALIGYSGFIGKNLIKSLEFDDLYNSKNIEDIKYKKYTMIVSSGNSSVRWRVNQNPEEDLLNIEKFIDCIDKVSTQMFVLISTIDVYKNPIGVDEDSVADADDSNPYGKNRLFLENYIKKRFENYLIVRLPIVYGNGFKKNVIYDLLNNHEIEKIDAEAKLQLYNVANLADDIKKSLDANIRIINIATEPVSIKEVALKVFGIKLIANNAKGLRYDMRSNYADIFSKTGEYLYDYKDIMDNLNNFKTEYKNES